MRVSLDIVDLLQLQEIWSRRPIITAFTRLEPRPGAIPARLNFNVDDLMPRLTKLKQSSVWRAQADRPTSDPARLPLSNFSDDYMGELYPEADSPAAQRQSIFVSAYSRFVVAHYRHSVEFTGDVLRTLADVRAVRLTDYLNTESLPLEGSPEWIPAEITDEIRALDQRYQPDEPGLPSAYVINDAFWSLFIKITPEEISKAVEQHCQSPDRDCRDSVQQALMALVEVANMWQRSPSVVGLCYQIAD